jgi:hypothetical protein
MDPDKLGASNYRRKDPRGTQGNHCDEDGGPHIPDAGIWSRVRLIGIGRGWCRIERLRRNAASMGSKIRWSFMSATSVGDNPLTATGRLNRPLVLVCDCKATSTFYGVPVSGDHAGNLGSAGLEENCQLATGFVRAGRQLEAPDGHFIGDVIACSFRRCAPWCCDSPCSPSYGNAIEYWSG